jgi:hypothetical protein
MHACASMMPPISMIDIDAYESKKCGFLGKIKSVFLLVFFGCKTDRF